MDFGWAIHLFGSYGLSHKGTGKTDLKSYEKCFGANWAEGGKGGMASKGRRENIKV